MRRGHRLIHHSAIVAAVFAVGCSSPTVPTITPPQPVFTTTSAAPNPVDHGIYADAGAKDGIDLEWHPDSTGNTSGYFLYRSTGDSTVGSDGLLKNRVTLVQLESSNQLVSPVDTSYLDTLHIHAGATYYYQLQAYYRSPGNQLTVSKPTPVSRATSFTYVNRVQLLVPSGVDSLHNFQPKFQWQDPNSGGSFQIIIQRLDTYAYVWSVIDQDFENLVTVEYPLSAPPLVPGVPYQWRVKWLAANGGSSSTWIAFTIVP